MIILFGGGDGGGFNIHDGHVDPIPPFGPEVLQHLRTIDQSLRSSTFGTPGVAEESKVFAGSIAKRVAGLVIVHGAPAKEFVFLDADGGFICGNGGQHVITLPPRPHIGQETPGPGMGPARPGGVPR